MKAVLISGDKDQREIFEKYASGYGMGISNNHDIIAVMDDEGELSGFSVLKAFGDYNEILFFLIFEEMRRKGCGSFLLREIVRSSEKNGAVIRCSMPDSTELKRLFEKEGFEFYPGRLEHTVSFGALHYSKLYMEKVAGKEPVNTKAFDECSDVEWKKIMDFFASQNIIYRGRGNKKLSSVTFVKGKVGALYLCERLPGGIVVYYVYSDKDHPEYLLNGLRVIHRIIEPLGEKGRELNLSFATRRPGGRELLIKLTGDPVIVKELVRGTTAVRNVAIR